MIDKAVSRFVTLTFILLSSPALVSCSRLLLSSPALVSSSRLLLRIQRIPDTTLLLRYELEELCVCSCLLELHPSRSPFYLPPLSLPTLSLPLSLPPSLSHPLSLQLGWSIALGPWKQLPLNMFVLWMAGNSISLFPIMMVVMMLMRPAQAVFNYKEGELRELWRCVCV